MMESKNRTDSSNPGGTGLKWKIISRKSLVSTLCAVTLALYGCSSKSGKTPEKVVVPTTPDKTEVKAVVTTVDSLVKANKGKGKGVVTGFLTGEGKSVASGLLKQAVNAGGERRLLTKNEIPLTGATVLIFNALKPTTLPDFKTTTDTLGNYTAVLDTGKYFGFAVYLDIQTFQLVTTTIPNMNPILDSAVKMDTATAIEDITAPTVSGVYDAASANSDGIFLVGSVADKGSKINISFSEPMARESISGIVLGKVDTTNTATSMILADTVKGVTVSWNGDSKILTLKLPDLTTGVQYGMIMPVTIKDLAKNPLEKEYKATFVTVATADLAAIPFSVSSTFPEDKGSIKPIQNPGISFSRPVEAFSVLKNVKIEPEIKGYFEVAGARAVFIHKEPLAIGKTYTVTIPATVLDLSGTVLTKAASYSFTVKDFEGAAKNNTGREKEVALTVESVFDAYLTGDVGRFGAAFHTNFRMYDEDGSIQSKGEFLDMIRKDVGDRQALSAGFPGPVFDISEEACKESGNSNRWKVAAEGGTDADLIWVNAYFSPGQSPRAYDLKGVEINPSELKWDVSGPRFTYKSKKYGYAPDMTNFRGPVNIDAAKGDLRFMGDLLKQSSTVVLEPVKLENKSEFNVDPNVTLVGDTAKLAVKMVEIRKYNRANFGEHNLGCRGILTDTSYQILRFTLVNEAGKWMVVSIVSPSKETNKEDFNKTVDTKDFGVKQMIPISLLSPLRDKAMGADGKIVFKFNGIKHDSLGGYLVGIAEDGKFCFGRPPFGALIFVKASNKIGGEESFTLNSAGGIESSNANVIMRRAQDLRLPGWERTLFENNLSTMFDSTKGFAGIYNWKVIAIKDTSAVQFLSNGFVSARYYGESDFGNARGYFACKTFPQSDAAFTNLQANQQNFVNTQLVNNANGSFGDMDQDGMPDQLEFKYKTDPRNRNSVPDFRVDTDADGMADFLEAVLDSNGTDSLITRKADAAGIKSQIAKLIALKIDWVDTDGDGFPDDVEMLYGFNPNDAKNNPGTRPRANAPVGVFAGKFQMGSNLNSISLKLYTDSLKLMWVAYSAVIGKDTLADTVRTLFDEMSGEIRIPVSLSKTGPDAGRALLLRGRYDAIQSLLMGPVDMITAVAKTSTNFGGGPYVGQFAASSRGEDVSRFLPGNNTNGAINNPTNIVNIQPTTVTYRLPPAGTSEGSRIIFEKGVVTLINDFGDTLAVVNNLNFRTQPNGSYEFFGESKTSNGTLYSRSELGGRISYDGQGAWILDGHFFQEFDSAGTHRSYPGQMNAKGIKADVTTSPENIMGTFKGWIAQDKAGTGFAVQPQNPVNTCDPSKGPCTPTGTCDPTKGPCNVNPNPQPTNSFSKPFVAGTTTFRNFLAKIPVPEGDYFMVFLNGKVFKVKNDSMHVQPAKSPMCGHVVVIPELLDMKDQSDLSIKARMLDSMALPKVSGTLFLVMEDQFSPGVPQREPKFRDSYENVQLNVIGIELRPVGADYGLSTMICPTQIGPNTPCDPLKGPCVTNPPCDPLKGPCVTNPPCDPLKGPCVTNPPCDPLKGPCVTNPPCDPLKGPCVTNPPCDPAKGPCGTVTPGDSIKPVFYKGPLENVGPALAFKNNMVKLLTASGLIDVKVDPTSVKQDSGMITVHDASAPARIYAFLGDKLDPTKPMPSSTNDLTVMEKPMMNPPVGSTGGTPADTTKPMFYVGLIEQLTLSLNSNNVVQVMTPGGFYSAKVNVSTIKQDKDRILISDLDKPDNLFAFIGEKMDPKKPMLSTSNQLIVMEQPRAVTQPVVTPPDSIKSAVFIGTIDKINQIISANNSVRVRGLNSLTFAKVNATSVASDGKIIFAIDFDNTSLIYVFMGDDGDRTKPALAPDGLPIVQLKGTI